MTRTQANRKVEIAQDKLIDVAEDFGKEDITRKANEIVMQLNDLRNMIMHS